MTGARTNPIKVVLLIMLCVLLAVVGYLSVLTGRQYLANRSFHPIAIPLPARPAAQVAGPLAAATGAPSMAAAPSTPARPSPAGVAAALAGPLANPSLGPSVSAQVFDEASGSQLFGQRVDRNVSPASTAKLLTAAAALTAYKPTDRFVTRVLAGPSAGSVVLVGGGDPTLSAAPAGRPTEYPEAGRISALASAVRASLGNKPITQVIVDDSLFSGAPVAPGWAAEDAPSSYASPITAAMVDAGRDAPEDEQRSAAPDLAAGNALAAALAGATVIRGRAPAAARQLAQVRSAPVGVLVEQMLRDSDNVIAEVLGRQVALAAHQPASFVGATVGIRDTLAPLSIGAGNGMRDASGLSVLDRLPAVALTQTLLAAAGNQHPRLRSVLTGLSVAGWDGSLVEQGRFTGVNAAADGLVRAKTGSLTGVSALAGVLTDADGRELVFAVVADQAPSEDLTRGAIDQLVLALVHCGCH